jgi:hypothetical protein
VNPAREAVIVAGRAATRALPLHFFDRTGAPAPGKAGATRVAEKARQERRLFCALCRHPVTHQDQRIRVNGGHEHRCTNPGGYIFDIGCFHEAAGCVAVGAATEAHTWFEGYAWRVALCAGCERHLGWRFAAPADFFHGLILDRLTSVAGTSR